MKGRLPIWILPALVASGLINILIFGMASLVSSERPYPQDLTEPVPVHLVKLHAPVQPEEKRVPEPRKPTPKPLSSFIPDLVRPGPNIPARPDISLAIDPDLLGDGVLEGEFIFNAEELDRPPQTLVKMPPVYPYKATWMDIEGHVTVRFLVAEDGTVSRVTILEASHPGLFDESVRKAVPKWRFSPGKIGGKNVSSWVMTTIRFELCDDDEHSRKS
ncbi:MAG: energy transducer TonB [Candidatus Eisenbacteria sp.]|nr:energy transducer TonB [Candidatus Eisenbacteria bacterium]